MLSGWVPILVTCLDALDFLYRNDGANDYDWLRRKVEGTVSNQDGIGTFTTVDLGTGVVGDEIVREIGAGRNS